MGFGIYLAVITRDASSKDDRLRVRVVPHMNGIPDTDCPYWSCFFKDQLITGKAGDLVWVIAGDDFDVGYILGYANYCTEDSQDFITRTVGTSKIPLSIPQDLREAVKQTSVDLLGQELDFINIKVTFWNETAIHFIDRSNGAFYMAFKNGTLYAFTPDGMKVSVRGGESKMGLDSTSFGVKATNSKVQSELVGLGLNPSAGVLVTVGESGEEATASQYVKA